MPYSVTDSADGCDGWAVIKDATGEVIGCHKTENQAKAQLTAVNIAEYGKRAADDLTAPEFMRANARRGLDYYQQGLAGDGLQPATVREAREMAAGRVSADKWRRISAWIARHLVDLDAADDDEITPGIVAHYLWGSGRTRDEANRAKDYADRVIARLDGNGNRAAKMPVAVTDIDGTIVTDGVKPVYEVIEAMDELDVPVIVVTGRPESRRQQTAELLDAIDLDYDTLIMAGSPSGKVEAVAELQKTYEIVAIWENNPETVDAYRKLGLTVYQVGSRANMAAANKIRAKLDKLR